MFKVIVEATTDADKELLDDFLRHLSYGLTDESGLKLRTIGWKWDGHSGGDDAYFGLYDKVVQVRTDDPEKRRLRAQVATLQQEISNLEYQIEMNEAGEDW